MTTPNDGGPAFPTNAGHFTNGATPGMSLRDWFAGHAMMPILQDDETVRIVCKALNIGSEKAVAKIAYTIADAMLAERERKVGE